MRVIINTMTSVAVLWLATGLLMTPMGKISTESIKCNLKANRVVREASDKTEEDSIEKLDPDSHEILEICVEAEAGNQDIMGKRLVVDVILNRMDSKDFPDDIEGVITQKYHFSSYWDGQMDKITEASEETKEAIEMELEQRTDDKILFFTAGNYNKYCTPAYKYGAHYFGY